MESANPALAGDVERELANLREQAGRIEALPLLGVLDEQRSASDDFAAMMGLAGDAEAGAGNAETAAWRCGANSPACCNAIRTSYAAPAT